MPMNNKERAEHAESAVLQYLQSKGESYNTFEDYEISDLICDLLHLADREGLDRKNLLKTALYHYEVETSDEEQANG